MAFDEEQVALDAASEVKKLQAATVARGRRRLTEEEIATILRARMVRAPGGGRWNVRMERTDLAQAGEELRP